MTYQTVTTINEDRTGGLWFGLAGGQGIIYYNTNATDRQWQVIGTPTLPSGFVHAIATDILGEVWVGTGVGVSRFRYTGTNQLTDGRWTHYNSSNSPVPDEAIRSVGYNGADNHLWIGTSGAGIVSFDLDLDWNISSPADHPLPIVGMCFNADRSIWFATTGDWAYHFVIDTDVWTQVGRSDTGALFPSHLVRAVAGTAQTAWFATENGLVRLRNGLTTVYDTLSSPLPSNDVRSLAMDWKGNLWIGTTGGLAKHREGGTRP
jgi:ligand-binding sensor domain-containing protein